MYAIEFNATVMDGKIEIPVEYMQQFSSTGSVKVILLKKEINHAVKTKPVGEKDFGFGVLSRYANPALWEQESQAWKRAAVEKHETC